MSGALVGDLGVGGEIWLMVSLLVLMTLFFKLSDNKRDILTRHKIIMMMGKTEKKY